MASLTLAISHILYHILVRTGSPPRRDAIHRVSHRPDGPTQGKNAKAGLRPERVRRDESRLTRSGLPTRLKILRRPKPPHEAGAPIGGELSITAGEPKANLRTEPTL